MSPGSSSIWIIVQTHRVMIEHSRGKVVSVWSWGFISVELQLVWMMQPGGEAAFTGLK